MIQKILSVVIVFCYALILGLFAVFGLSAFGGEIGPVVVRTQIDTPRGPVVLDEGETYYFTGGSVTETADGFTRTGDAPSPPPPADGFGLAAVVSGWKADASDEDAAALKELYREILAESADLSVQGMANRHKTEPEAITRAGWQAWRAVIKPALTNLQKPPNPKLRPDDKPAWIKAFAEIMGAL